MRLLTKPGGYIEIEAMVAKSVVPPGSTGNTYGIVRDITERKRAQQSLLDSERRFRDLFEHSPVAYQSLDEQGRFIDTNAELCRMLGYGREELLGKTFGELWSAATRDQFPGKFAWFVIQGCVNVELELICKDGEAIVVVLNGRIQRDPEGRFVRTHCVLHNITERKQAEAALLEAKAQAERANLTKSEFLSRMSHELRTPLNAVIGFSQLLEIGESDPLTPKQRECVGQIHRSGHHLLSLINEVLDLARIEAGRLDLAMARVSLCAAVDDALSLVSPLAHERNIRIDRDGSRHQMVWADPTRLRQVLLNLLSNAVKYSRARGWVSVACTAVPGGVRVAVSDTGEGIPDDKQSLIFQPFERLGADRNGIEGTGIGLTIAKRLVEAMQGRIGFNSRLGMGSTFWVELPAASDETETGQDTGNAADAILVDTAAGGSGTVLYVEDNPANVTLMKHVFKLLPGIELLVAPDAESGLAQIRRQAPDLILMDINLPGLGGLEAVRQLKADPNTRHIPVFATSSAAMPLDIETGMRAGFDAYLTKPFDMPELIRRIREAVESPVVGQA